MAVSSVIEDALAERARLHVRAWEIHGEACEVHGRSHKLYAQARQRQAAGLYAKAVQARLQGSFCRATAFSLYAAASKLHAEADLHLIEVVLTVLGAKTRVEFDADDTSVVMVDGEAYVTHFADV